MLPSALRLPTENDQGVGAVNAPPGDCTRLPPDAFAQCVYLTCVYMCVNRPLREANVVCDQVVNNSKQAKRLLEVKEFFQVPVKVDPHRSLNTCDGVVTSWDLSDCTEEEIKEGLKDQKVISVRRLKTRRSGTLKDTYSFVLTFALPKLPASIYVCYSAIQVRPYIPKPIRCFRCQRYGHTSGNCKGEELCGRCSLKKHEGDCSEKEKCVNCHRDHPAWSASCPIFAEEKKIQEIKTSKKITYGEAKKEFRALNPVFSGKSYSQVTAKKYVDAAVQTHTPSVCAPCKGVFLPAKPKNLTSISITKDKAKATAESDSSGENSPSSKKAKTLLRKTHFKKSDLEEDAVSDDMMDADPSEADGGVPAMISGEVGGVNGVQVGGQDGALCDAGFYWVFG
ncbi:uncharacterized protein LOC124170365 [Ischnura elegans]|uniref:uncharacterized protein LOC124170365 n=1 Tax=Ischnura elegans TaxID=197161 RepID=UPI001ED87819|nr:uncharacterized protein LOC124170365 [Ischnura elegans]